MRRLEKYQSIQYLRALAALMVVFHHARNPQPWLYDPIQAYGAGQAGVDIFFVISGFVMYTAARSERASTFSLRRIIRIVPLYWIATFLAFLSIEKSSVLHPGESEIAFLLKSLLFIPQYNLAHPSEIWPCLIAGWTLTYEMFFYFIFALGLVSRKLLITVALLLGVCLAAGLLIKSSNVFWRTYTDPLLAEFICGLLVARFQGQICKPAAILLLPLGLIALAASNLVDGPRLVIWGAPALAVVIGALALERSGRLADVRLPALLGDASYSIYLFQSFALIAASKIVVRLPLAGPPQLIAMILLGVAAATLVGLGVHLAIERPLTRLLGRRGAWRPRSELARS